MLGLSTAPTADGAVAWTGRVVAVAVAFLHGGYVVCHCPSSYEFEGVEVAETEVTIDINVEAVKLELYEAVSEAAAVCDMVEVADGINMLEEVDFGDGEAVVLGCAGEETSVEAGVTFIIE